MFAQLFGLMEHSHRGLVEDLAPADDGRDGSSNPGRAVDALRDSSFVAKLQPSNVCAVALAADCVLQHRLLQCESKTSRASGFPNTVARWTGDWPVSTLFALTYM